MYMLYVALSVLPWDPSWTSSASISRNARPTQPPWALFPLQQANLAHLWFFLLAIPSSGMLFPQGVLVCLRLSVLKKPWETVMCYLVTFSQIDTLTSFRSLLKCLLFKLSFPQPLWKITPLTSPSILEPHLISLHPTSYVLSLRSMSIFIGLLHVDPVECFVVVRFKQKKQAAESHLACTRHLKHTNRAV